MMYLNNTLVKYKKILHGCCRCKKLGCIIFVLPFGWPAPTPVKFAPTALGFVP